jgi:hypothetical protein
MVRATVYGDGLAGAGAANGVAADCSMKSVAAAVGVIAALRAPLENAEHNLPRNAVLKQKEVLAEREYTISSKARDAAAARVEKAGAQGERAAAQQKARPPPVSPSRKRILVVLGAEREELRVRKYSQKADNLALIAGPLPLPR